MVLAAGFLALLAASYLMLNYVGSQSRALDQLIAMEDQAEQLRKRRAYDSLAREKAVRKRNQLLVRIARKRRDIAAERKLRADDINRMMVARRQGQGRAD